MSGFVTNVRLITILYFAIRCKMFIRFSFQHMKITKAEAIRGVVLKFPVTTIDQPFVSTALYYKPKVLTKRGYEFYTLLDWFTTIIVNIIIVNMYFAIWTKIDTSGIENIYIHNIIVYFWNKVDNEIVSLKVIFYRSYLGNSGRMQNLLMIYLGSLYAALLCIKLWRLVIFYNCVQNEIHSLKYFV